jgi:DHA2 family multidrug resistance protein
MTDKGLSRAAVMMVVTAGIASLLEIVDTSIVNVAVPTMMGNLGATLEDISWVVTGYIISNAIILPISGWLGVRFGRRKYYITCILLFVGASVACGLAPNLASLVVFRVLQGMAGGALLPTSQALIQEAFPGRAGLGSALYGMVVIIGPTVGPPLGGYLTDHFGWRSIFNINLPLGLLAAFLASIYVTDHEVEEEHQEHHDRMKKAPVDFIGLSLLILGVGCLQYVLERGQPDDWFSSNSILLCSGLAVFAIPAFVLWELKVEHPIMDLRLYKNLALVSGTLLMGAVGGMLYGLIFFIPIFASVVLGTSAAQTGNLFTPGAILAGVMMPVVGLQVQKRDPRYLIFFGLLAVDCALLMVTRFTVQSGYWDLFWPLLIRGLGMPFLFVPVNAVVLGQFRGPALGQAAGIMNLSRQLGGSMGIAFLSTMFIKTQSVVYANMLKYISPLNPNFNQWAAGFKAAGTKFSGELGMTTPNTLLAKEAYYRVQKQVFVVSFDTMAWVMVICFALAAIPMVFLKKPPATAPEGGPR